MSHLVIDGVTEQDGVMVIWAQTPSWLVPFPGTVPWLARCMVFTARRSRTCLRTAARCSCGEVRRISAMGRLCSQSLIRMVRF